DTEFIADQRRRGGPIVAILPGSRQAEIDQNLELLVGAMQIVHAARPDARFLVAPYRSKHGEQIDARLRHAALPAEVFVGRTPEVIALADACLAVSGSVSLELLHRGVPSAIVYRTSEMYVRLSRIFLKVPHICLVNLIAGRELFPEYLTSSSDPRRPAADVLRWLNDPLAAGALRAELAKLFAEVGRPGACERAARAVVDLVAVQGEEDRAEDVALSAEEDVVGKTGQVVQAEPAVTPPPADVATDAPVPAGLVRRGAEIPLAASSDVERPALVIADGHWDVGD